jgi:hypothetical protein
LHDFFAWEDTPCNGIGRTFIHVRHESALT